jgi:hypothetical protein
MARKLRISNMVVLAIGGIAIGNRCPATMPNEGDIHLAKGLGLG